ncbi:MAG TPA: type I methionyl aminopeptidase [Alloacidobacterium sp.]|jgi:methionyl aminopeptidase|nr:type I methionyl aminopeptidase [Alloacidobacterium sp.]
MAIMIKTPQEVEKMRRSGTIVREILDHVRSFVKPGATTLDLENAAAAKIAELGATPAFKGYHGYPAVLCTSINNEVVHGIPSANRVLREGDIVSIDTGVIIDGFYGDSAITVPVGEKIAPKTKRLLDVTKASLESGIRAVKVGASLGDIGAAVQEVVEADGFSVVREFVGHGIGTRLHEDPQVPNFGRRGQGLKLREGMVLCIEPMVNSGKPDVQVLSDGWTAVTQDGSLSAHFEHTVAVTANGAMVLTQ